MREVCRVEFYHGSREERLPDFEPDFPYIATRAEMDRFSGRFAPWHWHREVELFYLEEGGVEYCTPGGSWTFPAGSGGFVNSNVLHMSRTLGQEGRTTGLLHIFDASIVGGLPGGRIEQKYILPLVTAPRIEILPLYPDNPEQEETLSLIRGAFGIAREEFAGEMRLRDALSEIWRRLLEIAGPKLGQKGDNDRTDSHLKAMMVYIHEHYAEKLSVAEIAGAAFISERECFREFHDGLHLTPLDYVRDCRLREACRLLAQTKEPVTTVSHACGLGSSSYFGKVFRDKMGCTPLEYRLKWRDSDKNGRE